jgi:putative transposase
MSPQERENIVNYRRDQGYPLHAPPHPFRGPGAYLISAANFEHRAIMGSPNRRTEFELLLLHALQDIANKLIAWVILPNHYHFLATVESLDPISAAIKLLHGKTSRMWNLEDELTGKRTVWYKFADTYMRDDTQFHTAFNYIHQNPVKHGYVSDPYEWPWSSLLMYYGDQGKNWIEEQSRRYKPHADFGRGWDDDIRND